MRFLQSLTMSIVILAATMLSRNAVLAQSTKPELWAMGEVLHQQSVMMDEWKTVNQVNLTYAAGTAKPDQEPDLLGPKLFDVYQTTALFVANWAERGLLEELSDVIKNPSLRWQDVAAQCRDYMATYDGKVWGVPVDLDPALLYFRRDLVAKAPVTWEELIAAASEYHMKDLNGDGIPDAGFCMSMVEYMPFTIATSVLKTDAGVRKGPFFDINPDERTPMMSMMNTEPWAYALRIVGQLYNISHFKLPDLSNRSYSAMNDNFNMISPLMRNGRCAFMVGLTSTGTFVLQNSPADNATKTFWRGKQGVARPPGSSKAYDRATKKMVECTPRICANMETPNVNRPGYINGGGIVVVRKDTPRKELAKSFIAWASNRIDVRRWGGINPFRKSQMNASYFVEAASIGYPWDYGDAQTYLGAILESVELPSAYASPRIPLYPIISTVTLAAMKEMCRADIFKNYTTTEYEILDNMDKAWRDAMVQQGQTLEMNEVRLRKSYSLPPLIQEKETYWWVSLIVIAVVAIAGYVLFRVLTKYLAVANAPRDASNFAASFVVVKGVSLLWEQAPEHMPRALAHFTKIVKKVSSSHGVYVSRKVGDNFLLVADNSAKLVRAAADIQREVQKTSWSSYFRPVGEEGSMKNLAADQSSHTIDRSTNAGTAAAKRRATAAEKRSARTHTDKDSESSARTHKSSIHADHHVRRSIEVGISVHEGAGRIEYHEDTNTYEYNGAVVEDVALIADYSRPGQILVSDVTYATASEESKEQQSAGTFVVVGARGIRGRSIELFQYNVEGLRVVSSKHNDEKDDAINEDVDSVAAALDASTSGLSIKKITVLSVLVVGLDVPPGESEKEAMIKRYHDVYGVVEEIVSGSKGQILSFEGGRFTITFNAFSPTPAQVKRAGLVAIDIRDALSEDMKLRTVCGLASGRALVGTTTTASRDSHKVLVGNVVNRARTLERLALTRPRDCSILASVNCVPELGSAVYCQTIDIARFATFALSGDATCTVTSVVSLMSVPADDDAAGDEWMYTLEKNNLKNPFANVNRSFELVATGLADEARATLDALLVAAQEEPAARIAVPAFEGVQRLRAILGAGIAEYVAALPELY